MKMGLTLWQRITAYYGFYVIFLMSHPNATVCRYRNVLSVKCKELTFEAAEVTTRMLLAIFICEIGSSLSRKFFETSETAHCLILSFTLFGCSLAPFTNVYCINQLADQVLMYFCNDENTANLLLLFIVIVSLLTALSYRGREKLSKKLARLLTVLKDTEDISLGTQTDIALPPEWIPGVLMELPVVEENEEAGENELQNENFDFINFPDENNVPVEN